MDIFQTFFFGNISQENVFYDILERKNAFLGSKNKKVKKSKNWDFSKGVSSWFSSKNCNFSNFFWGNIGQKNVFYDILELKKRLSRLKKTTSSKSQKIEIFPKALTHGFGQKISIFPTFFLGNIGKENVFYDILERKNAFLRSKNIKFKRSKSWDISKGVNPWFWSKNSHFSNFYF